MKGKDKKGKGKDKKGLIMAMKGAGATPKDFVDMFGKKGNGKDPTEKGREGWEHRMGKDKFGKDDGKGKGKGFGKDDGKGKGPQMGKKGPPLCLF